MKFLLIAFFLSFVGLSFSYPVSIQSRDTVVDPNADTNANTTVATKDAAVFGGVPGGGAPIGTKVNAASVMNAANAFANDAMTVSASLNSLGAATSSSQIRSLASTAFQAESDEDSRRAVLFSAAGSAGSTANQKIVRNTPTVLNGLKAMIINPSMKAVQANIATIERARNPQILPSITSLSQSAFEATGIKETAVKFPATTGAAAAAAAAN